MKSSLGMLRKFALHKSDDGGKRDFLASAKLDELTKAAQDIQGMRNFYDSLLSAAVVTENFTYEFSESLREMGSCLLEKTALLHDAETCRVLFMLGKVEFELQKIVDNYSSPVIPTLSGKSPASQENEEVVSAYRREEKERMNQLLRSYPSICRRFKVSKGIVEMVEMHGIKKLVMGAIPENCIRVKRSSTKASYTAKYAPWFCEIWIVNKGKHLWTREANDEVKLLESARAHEVKLREAAEEALRTTIDEQEKILEEKEEHTRELDKSLRNIALLNNRVQETNTRRDEAAQELKQILASIATLQLEKQKICRVYSYVCICIFLEQERRM